MLPLKWKIDKLLSLGACWVQIGSIRSQGNWHQARLLLSSLCLIPKLKATCLVGVHLRLSSALETTWFCLNFATMEREGLLQDLWIRTFVSASENLWRTGVQCYAEHYTSAGAVARRDN